MTDKKNGEQESLQQIFYGAPGTGKSYKIKEMIDKKGVDHIRTTFHPDSDYSTFVGAYKPTMDRLPIYDNLGQPVLIAGSTMNKEQITYKFVPQAFLKAYVGAWEKYNGVNEKVEDEILVIEEINRGNCAQIFGDLFQLLDRNENGFSEYPITTDADMKKYLKGALGNINLNEKVKKEINDFCKGNKDICKQVLEGEILLLPNNLYIWATMNTSDQSLFPIDSAFKRRWDWQYVPISDARKNWVISVNGSEYDWWEFLQEINKRIYEATFSEDKQLGYFFCKAKYRVIDAKTFVGKVIFYLWNDVFKDMDSDLFTYEDGGEKKKLTFGEFYKVDSNGEVVVNDSNVGKFLENLGLSKSIETTENKSNTTQSNSKNYDTFTINNKISNKVSKSNLVVECIKEYMEQKENVTAQEILNEWGSLNLVSGFIKTQQEFDGLSDDSKRRHECIDCQGGPLYLTTNGYTEGNIDDVIRKIEEKFGFKIDRILKK